MTSPRYDIPTGFLIFMAIITFVGVAFLCCESFYEEETLLERLNQEGADIGSTDEYFRFKIFARGDTVYTSGNMSWNEMVTNGYVVNGEFNMKQSFWNSFIDKNNIYDMHRFYNWDLYNWWSHTSFDYRVDWEVYY